MSLEDIVSFYLRDQHSRCRKPVLTVPEFSLLKPHKCPEPDPKLTQEKAEKKDLKQMFEDPVRG